jgi:hypothetical protein
VAGRQLQLPRRRDLSPPPGAGTGVPGVGPVPRSRRHAALSPSVRCCSARCSCASPPGHR